MEDRKGEEKSSIVSSGKDKIVRLGRRENRMDVQFQCAMCIIIVVAHGSSHLVRNFLTIIIPSSYILRVIIILSFSPGKTNSARCNAAVYADGNETSVPRKEDPLKSNKVYAHEQFNDGKLYRTE